MFHLEAFGSRGLTHFFPLSRPRSQCRLPRGSDKWPTLEVSIDNTAIAPRGHHEPTRHSFGDVTPHQPLCSPAYEIPSTFIADSSERLSHGGNPYNATNILQVT
jgi:hypothetical protein